MEGAQPDLKGMSLIVEVRLSVCSAAVIVRVKLSLKAAFPSFVPLKQEFENQMAEYASTNRIFPPPVLKIYIQLMRSIP